MKFSGKNVLITGASKGIGASIAKTLASFGLKVWINYRSKPELADVLKDEILAQGGNAAVIKFDASKEDEFENGIKTIVESDGELSYLVNNAGVTNDKLALRMKLEDFTSVVDTNLSSAFLGCREALKTMSKKRFGAVVNIASIVGEMGNAGQTNYSASKGVSNWVDYIEECYQNETTDEFIQAAKNENYKGMQEDDGLIFVNFRNDRMKQLIEVLNSQNFKEFEREKVFENLLTMSVYDDKFNIPVLFEKEEIKNTLSETISKAGLTQLHTAETEKYAHVTFFFNGGKEELLENETRVLIPSPKVKTYDEKPEMSAFEVCDVVKKGIEKGEDFIVVNFANGDMVGHTGDFNAAIKAVEAVDVCLGEVVECARKHDYAFIITSDHGNCEAMQDKKGNLLTNHTTFDVFVFVEAKGVDKLKENMGLSNIAASVLKILNLEIPKEMNEALF